MSIERSCFGLNLLIDEIKVSSLKEVPFLAEKDALSRQVFPSDNGDTAWVLAEQISLHQYLLQIVLAHHLRIIVSSVLVLTFITLPRTMKGAKIAKSNACKTNVMVLNLQTRLYYANKGKWPSSFNALINEPNYFPDGPPKCPFGNPYTMHISNHWINQHNY